MATNTAIATRKMMSSTVSSPRKWTALARNRLAKSSESARSELDKDGQVDPIFNFLEVWCESRDEGARGSADIFDNRSCGAGRRCNASRPREVRNIRSAMVELPTKSNVLAGHVIERCRSIPGFEGVARILGGIRCARGSRRSVDWRQQHQIAAR